MSHYCFTCPEGREVAGCVERICCYSPFLRPRLHPQTRQPLADQQGRPLVEPDAGRTWQWLMQLNYAFPQGVQFLCTVTNPMTDQSQRSPNVYCIQTTAPQASRAQVDAPYAQPVGNRGVQSAPVMASPQGAAPRHPSQAGMYDTLPDAALAGNSDPMLGEIDAAGGTYTDIDGNGNEVPRQMQQLSSPPVQQR